MGYFPPSMIPRRSFLALLLAGSLATSWAAGPLKLLTIGNSFADDATTYLPSLAKAGGKDLVVYRVNLGGHSLEQHAGYLAAYTADPADPKGSPYKSIDRKDQVSLPQALKADKWNFVTIQQVSHKSPDPATYEPYATQLIDEIRKDAPQAKILVHQTWAYREDSPSYKDGKTQQTMYDGLKAAYEKLAHQHALEILPSGTAFQNARQSPDWKFQFPDPNFDYANPKQGAAPDQKGSLNMGWRWAKNKEGELKFTLDANHANVAGKYLAASVWYEVIFGTSVLDNTFVPEGLTPEQAAQLRQLAHDTVQEQKKAQASPTPAAS